MIDEVVFTEGGKAQEGEWVKNRLSQPHPGADAASPGSAGAAFRLPFSATQVSFRTQGMKGHTALASWDLYTALYFTCNFSLWYKETYFIYLFIFGILFFFHLFLLVGG